MSSEHWVRYELATGETREWFSVSRGEGRLQYCPPGSRLLRINPDVRLASVSDPERLELFRIALWEEVKFIRAQVEAGGIVTPHGVLKSDDATLSRVGLNLAAASAALTAGVDFSVGFTMADNATVPLTAIEMVEVGLAAQAVTDGWNARAQALRAQIEEPSATLPQLLQIDLAAGWEAEI